MNENYFGDMKRRNFFKALAAVAVIPILPEPKKEYRFVSEMTVKGSGWRHGQYVVGMWKPTGQICFLEVNAPAPQHGPITVQKFNFPRHGVNSFEIIEGRSA